MNRALLAVVIGLLLAAVAYAGAFLEGGAPGWSGWAMAAALALVLPGTLALGGRRRGAHAGRLVSRVALALGALLAVGFALALALPTEAPGDPLWLGLPRRAAIVVYGIGLLPFLLLPWAYARDFAADDLDPAAVHALQDECARLQQAHGITRVDAGPP